MKRVVSLSVYDSEIAAIDTCLNYIVVGEVDAVVLHVDAGSKTFNPRFFTLLLDAIEPLRGKVFVSPLRLDVPNLPGRTHSKVVHRAHLNNYMYVRSFLPFEYFLMVDSHSLVMKKGLVGYVHGITDGLDIVPEKLGIPWLARAPHDPVSAEYDRYHSCLDGAFLHRERME